MITVSLCMIVKNEERTLERCLRSVAEVCDEIIIVDTGSTDKTKEIAGKYTDKIYDFTWINDFAAARNYAFSLATKEYIYSADADEVLDAENRRQFQLLKENLLPEIDIVQMKYKNQLSFDSVYNFDEEYRPKLFKRLRTFVWEAPIHETVRLTPVVFDSDISILHFPEMSHVDRDLFHFYTQCEKGYRLDKRLHTMYARELLLAGTKEDLERAKPFFEQSVCDTLRDAEEIAQASCILARFARMTGNAHLLLKYSSKVLAEEANSEICCELGHYYEDLEDYEEAAIWYYNAAYETEPILSVKAGHREPLEGLVRCYEALGCPEQAAAYSEEILSGANETLDE